MISAFDVVQYILIKLESTTAMKLQKLVYYCQAWSIVWDGEALFKEGIEAWANGPVVEELYEVHRGMYKINKNSKLAKIGDATKLTREQIDTIDAVLEYYNGMSPQEISDLTHAEDPWQNARKGVPDGERGDQIITKASLEEYYLSLNKGS